jgi:class 3 adenylate cyclase
MRSYGECKSLADPAAGTGVPVPAADQTREERRTVSVLFADIVGFTAVAGQLDPEDVRALQNEYFRAVGQVIRRWGGVVEKYVGDAVLAVFGAPRSDEWDAFRAVRAGLEIQDALADLRLPDGSPLRARVGIATGETIVDLAAVQDGGQALVSGDVVNTAARVQAHAAAGNVVVTAATHRATAPLVRYQDLPPAAIAGKPTPVAIWRACGAAPRPTVQLDGGGAPMLGRNVELSALLDCLTRIVQERMPQLVSIVGAAGSGKSRLVGELASRAKGAGESPAQWWVGHCSPWESGSFEALAEMAGSHPGVNDDASAAPAASLRGVPGVDVWRRVLLAAAERRPLVLVVEDVHHAEPAFTRFLCELVKAAGATPQPLPLAVIVTHRPEPAGLLPGEPDVTVTLQPLGDPETRSLLAHLLDRAGQPAALADRLLPLAAGNPRYAEEYVRMLAEQASAVEQATTAQQAAAAQQSGIVGQATTAGQAAAPGQSSAAGQPVAAWHTTAAGQTTVDCLPMPERVRRMVSARLDQVGEADRTVLQAAAVLGTKVRPDAVATLLRIDPVHVHAALQRLERHELLIRRPSSTPTREPEYTFGQVAIRQVAYLRLPRAVRAAHHRTAAQWLHGIAAANRPDMEEERARHWLAAADLALALHHNAEPDLVAACDALAAAGDGAMRRRAPRQAGGLAGRALYLWPATGDAANHARLLMLALYADCLASNGRPATSGPPAIGGQTRRLGPADHRARPRSGMNGITPGRARSP